MRRPTTGTATAQKTGLPLPQLQLPKRPLHVKILAAATLTFLVLGSLAVSEPLIVFFAVSILVSGAATLHVVSRPRSGVV